MYVFIFPQSECAFRESEIYVISQGTCVISCDLVLRDAISLISRAGENYKMQNGLAFWQNKEGEFRLRGAKCAFTAFTRGRAPPQASDRHAVADAP